jgi:hypothetical protein
MNGMAGGYPLTVRLRLNRGLMAFVLAAHGGAALALFSMALPWWALIVGMLTVLVSARQAWRAQQAKAGLALELFSDGILAIREEPADGEMRLASVAPGAVVFPFVLWFTLLPRSTDGDRRPRRLMLLESEVGDEWKMLRTWLRHCASRPSSVL